MIKKITIGLIVVVCIVLVIMIFPFNNSSNNNHVNDSNTVSEYIDIETNNILKSYSKSENINIKLTKTQYKSIYKAISDKKYTFKYSNYYGLDEVISLYNKVKVNKKTDSDLLNNEGLLDVNKLIDKVKKNNEAYMSQGKDAINSFYKEMSSSDMHKICNIICEVINNQFVDIDISKTANTLMNLKMFEKTGSASNAYITNDLTFVYNPTMTSMYSSMQSITGISQSEEETFKSVITHEVMHLLQYSSSDNNSENGIETGICRMYNVPNLDDKVPVDSLWYSWLLDASAEINMAKYLNVGPGTYAKKISYVNSFNLSRFHELELENKSIDDLAYCATLEDVFNVLNQKTNQEKQDFLAFMYSIEITQTDPDDFWDNYTSTTNTSPNEERKLAIRMEIREDAINYLTYHFYLNLVNSIYEGKINDLNTLFYMMKLWEIDCYNHLKYTKTTSSEYAKGFVNYQHTMQEFIFDIFSDNISDIRTLYDEYDLQYQDDNNTFDNCDLDKYSTYKQKYISQLKNNYNTSHFVSQKDIYEYFKNN